MIAGIGTDMIEIQRIQKAVEQNQRFITKNFTLKEQAYFKQKNNAYQTIAGNFAAKEAVSKALGTGFRGFGLMDIEIVRNELGGPVVHLYKQAEELRLKKKIDHIWISISHCENYAIAYAIAEIN